MTKSNSPEEEAMPPSENQIIAKKHLKDRGFDAREFDIILYALDAIPYSVIREFESLSLRIAIGLHAPTEPDHSEGISVPQQPSTHASSSFYAQEKPSLEGKDGLPTMLQVIKCPLSQIQNITSKTNLLINLSADSLATVTTIIEACIETDTNYVDCCTNTEIIKHIFTCYTQDLNIKVVQGCCCIPFLVDLGVFSLGKIHEIKEIESTVMYPPEYSAFACAMLVHENNTFNSLRFNYETKTYEVFLGGSTDIMISKSRHYFRKRGIFHVKASAYLSIRHVFAFLIYFFIIFVLSQFAATKKCIPSHKKFEAGKGSSMNDSIVEITFNGNVAKHDKKIKMTITASGHKNDVSAVCLSQTAVTLVEDAIISETGALTPAMALHGTRITERLAYKHIKFQYFYSE